MKKKFIYLLIFCSALIVACSTTKQTYLFPKEMTPTVQASYTEICDKGKVLYDINCAGCHTTKKWGKEFIPDFTPEQLESYQIRVANAIHEPIMNDEQIPAEELGMIMTFLTYKPKSGITVVHKSVDSH
jgi:mono/diheme cytochrome c family protein